ncbi:MAG: maf protein [Gammaproteobacteria bacterium]|nr:MAG: maf protein [Gammaproteobacteria bacterium]TND06853.1 MAG: maf protein [Gammaproteobacteria bacterium]
MTPPPPTLILASSSPYRRELLQRLGLPFSVDSPEIDEGRLRDESPGDLVTRLAIAKAAAVGARWPAALVIGSDQVAAVEGTFLGKPGTAAKAVEQLQQTSGKRVDFLTGICLLNTASGRLQTALVCYSVFFRRLTNAQIRRYVERERPLDCSGAFKSEGLGAALVERSAGDDPSALIGLPLCRLVQMLDNEGIDVLSV